MPYVTSDGRIVDKKPVSYNPLVWLLAIFWGIIGFVWMFFSSCFPPKKQNAVGGGVIHGKRPNLMHKDIGNGSDSLRQRPSGPPPPSNVRGVSDLPSSCSAAGGG